MTFIPSNPLAAHLIHSCGGVAEEQELIAAINASGGGGGFTFDAMSNAFAGGGGTSTDPSAYDNIGIGSQSFDSLTTEAALQNITTGVSNIAIGSSALGLVTSGNYNLAIGESALYHVTLGSLNTAVGADAAFAITTGNANLALGFESLFRVTTGQGNVGVGNLAGQVVVTGSDNVAIGNNSGPDGDFSSTVCIGPNSVAHQDHGISIGELAASGADSIAIGVSASATASDSVCIGNNSQATASGVFIVGGTVTDSLVVGFSGSTAPADGDISTGQGFLYWNFTPGSSALKIKGKDSGGTVFTSSLSGINTGDQTITLTGDVTGSGSGSFAVTIASHAVTYGKIQQASTQTLLGNPTGSTADVQEITLGTGLSFSGSVLNATGSGTGTVTTVSVVTANGLQGSVANPTTTPAITLSFTNESASTVLAGPTSGGPATPTFRTLVSGDIPALSYVTSVNVSGGTTGLTFSGGPITSSGTITLSGTLIVGNGGTGLGTLTAHAVLLGEGTSNVGFATVGTSGRVLIDQGGSADPSFNAFSGDVFVTNTGATTIQPNVVTYAKIQQESASTILGNPTNATANVSEITLGAGIGFFGTAGTQIDSNWTTDVVGNIEVPANSNTVIIDDPYVQNSGTVTILDSGALLYPILTDQLTDWTFGVSQNNVEIPPNATTTIIDDPYIVTSGCVTTLDSGALLNVTVFDQFTDWVASVAPNNVEIPPSCTKTVLDDPYVIPSGTVTILSDQTSLLNLTVSFPIVSNLVKITHLTTASVTPFVPQSSTRSLLVFVWAAGGGGGGCGTAATNGAAGGGGGAGGFTWRFFDSPLSSSYAFSVGTGGPGGIGAATGTSGGNSQFNNSGTSSKGGSGGAGDTVAAGPRIGGFGGTGGTGSSNDLAGRGEAGGDGIVMSATSVAGGTGGSSTLGGGSFQQHSQGNGNPGSAPGSGGGGAAIVSGGASVNGGAGADGRIIIWEFA